MKSLFIVAATILLALAFTSCKKDGQYAPKEKISKVYVSTSNSPEKHLECVWTWDDKKLSKIDYLYGFGDVFWTETFKYDSKNRIERVEDLKFNEYVQYTYDGNKLKGMEYYCDGELWQTTTFTYDGNKISRMDLVINNGITIANKARFSLIPKEFKNKISPKNDGSGYEVSIELTWDGDNVSYMKMTSTNSGEYHGEHYSYEYLQECNYTYDNKLNPMKGLWNMGNMTDEECMMFSGVFSKNNVTSITCKETESYTENGQTETDTYTFVRNYNIAYDGKFPTEIMLTSQNEESSPYTHTTYYEYE